MTNSETIAAIATAMGEAGIAVIRVSGKDAVRVVDRVFRGGMSLSNVLSHTVWYGHIYSLKDNSLVDEVLVTVMKSPRTFTGEDTVEISTHGGLHSVQDVLVEILRAGARLAEPGEFTKRAFLSGRIDLTQAEGIMELIQSQTKAAKKAALRQVEGSMAREIRSLRDQLIRLLALIEVNFDYPEHDEEEATAEVVGQMITQVSLRLRNILDEANNGRIMRQGIKVVIIGKPNAGKSSLLNQLTRIDRAIVTDIPGTTRDVLEERIQIQGLPLTIVDTAGIRRTDDVVEKIGVERSRKALKDADLLLLLIDQSQPLSDIDQELLQEAIGYPFILLLTKSDLPSGFDQSKLIDEIGSDSILTYSIYDPTALKTLESLMIGTVLSGQRNVEDVAFLANTRQIHLLETALFAIDQVLISLQEGQTLDLLAVDLHSAWVALGEIIGETPRDDLLDQIFSQFCLGK